MYTYSTENIHSFTSEPSENEISQEQLVVEFSEENDAEAYCPNLK